MEDINYLLKCSVIEQLPFNRTQLVTNVSLNVPLQVTKTAGFGAFIGFVLAAVANAVFSQKFRTILFAPSWKRDTCNAKTLPRAIALVVLVLILPLLVVFLLIALGYKLLCALIIKNKDKYFVGFLDSFDVFWSLEDDTTKSVINVLGVIESDSPAALVINIKHKLINILPNSATDKLFFRRNEDYGFYYWRRYSSIDINQYVAIIDHPVKSDTLKMEDLEMLMNEISNQSLPYNDEALFQILVTKQRVSNYDKERGEYGIVFRIHHSVGDGVALIEFLCKTLADNEDDCPINMFSNPEKTTQKYNTRIQVSPNNLMEMIEKLWEMPICFVDGILRKPDDNCLHGPTLIGGKIHKWTESDENLLTMVKEIKSNVDTMKFSDVLASALSNGLYKYFSQTMTHIPDDVAVVLPIRFPKSSMVDNGLKLENDFSVSILDLPVKRCEGGKIVERCDALRRSADPLTNYYLLKIFNNVLPKQVLQPLFNSSQATMAFSNLPGPQRLDICGGNTLKKLVFFVPLKGNTGLGVTALCYDGVLRFGAVADSALVSGPDQLAIILDGMVEEIKRMHQMYVR